MEDFNQDIEAFFIATEESECTRCPGNTTQGRWELVSRRQLKCPRLSHRWVTWGTCLLEEMETKPGVDGRTNHSTILILLGYHITD